MTGKTPGPCPIYWLLKWMGSPSSGSLIVVESALFLSRNYKKWLNIILVLVFQVLILALPANSQTVVNVFDTTALYTWSVPAGAFPPGLTLNGNGKRKGKIKGIPTASETFSLTFKVTDSLGDEASKMLTTTVSKGRVELLVKS